MGFRFRDFIREKVSNSRDLGIEMPKNAHLKANSGADESTEY